jgi:acylglycerol lipase
MKQQEGYFSEQDQSIYYQYWLPESPPRAILLVIHGVNEHSGRYQHLAKFFTERGYAAYGLDLIGHGKSSGTRSFAKDLPAFIDPILNYLNMIKEWQPGLPVYLVGHSMGGLIGANILIDHQDIVQGAVLSGPLTLIPEYVSEFTIKTGKFLSSIMPKMRLLALDSEGLSRDKAVVQAYRDDPLVYNGKMTARISNVMNDGIARITADGSKIRLPILLLHGSDDSLCDPECSIYLHNLISSDQNQLIIYDGFFHEVYNEPEQETVFNDVLNWLDGLSG